MKGQDSGQRGEKEFDVLVELRLHFQDLPWVIEMAEMSRALSQWLSEEKDEKNLVNQSGA